MTRWLVDANNPLTGRVTTLWHYYLAFGILGGAGISFIQVPAAAIVSRVAAEVRAFIGDYPQNDDITLIAIRKK